MEAFVLFVYVGLHPIAIKDFKEIKDCAVVGQHIISLNPYTPIRAVCVDSNGEVKFDSNLQ